MDLTKSPELRSKQIRAGLLQARVVADVQEAELAKLLTMLHGLKLAAMLWGGAKRPLKVMRILRWEYSTWCKVWGIWHIARRI